jgi:hypothetical protein
MATSGAKMVPKAFNVHDVCESDDVSVSLMISHLTEIVRPKKPKKNLPTARPEDRVCGRPIYATGLGALINDQVVPVSIFIHAYYYTSQ